MKHVVLLGDSIFDNAAYVPDGPPVIEQLRSQLSPEWTATLLAVDGDVTEDVHRQLQNLPEDASHLVVSCGGNDALRYLPVLTESVSTVSEALGRFGSIRSDFQSKYRRMLGALQASDCNVVACTVYDRVPDLGATEFAALAMFNEIILREAIGASVRLIDLRHVCSESSDYSPLSPIEPSEQGGEKIVTAIADALRMSESDNPYVEVHK